MNTDDFEQKLQRRPMRQVPAEWREGILAIAKSTTSHRPAILDPQQHLWWRELIWPYRRVWAGVVCAWLLIIGLNAASFERAPRVAGKVEPRSGEEIRAFVEQRRMLAQLTDSLPEPANTRRPNPPGPRSDRATIISAA